jgi:O-antigen/teichoic acid export membrane protein
VFGNTVVFVALVLSGLLNFLSISIFSRMLTPDEYGKYALVISGLAFAYAFLYFWLANSFIRFGSAGKKSISDGQIASFYSVYLILAVLSSIVIYILSISLGHYNLPSELWLFILLALISEALFNAFSVHARFINLSPLTFSFFTVIRSVLAIVLGWYFVKAGYGYMGAIAAVSFSFFVCLIVLFFQQKIYKHIFMFSFDRIFIKEVCSFGLPIVFVLAMQSAISATDRFLLVLQLGAETAGQYSVSQDLVVKLLIFMVGITHRVFFPIVIMKMDTSTLDDVKKQLNSNITYILLMLIPAAFAIVFFAENIVFVVLGEEFRSVSIELMPYQVFISMLTCLTMFYVVCPFYLKKKTKLLILPSLFAFIANLMIGYLAIGRFGMYGALLGSFVAYLVYFLFSLYIGRKLLVLPVPIASTIKIIVSSMLMVLALLPLKHSYGVMPLFLLIMLGMFVYTIAILAFNISNIRTVLLDKIKGGMGGSTT